MKKIFLFLCICAYCTMSQAAQIKLEFEEVAQAADLIFIGTIDKQTSSWNEKNTMIFTSVFFKDINVIYSSTKSVQKNETAIKLTYAGGKIAEANISISDMPHFKDGTSYLIFMKDDGKVYANPIIGGYQGLFEIIEDKETKSEYLINSGKKILLGCSLQKLIYSSQKLSIIKNGIIIYEPESEKLNDINLTPKASSSTSIVKAVNLNNKNVTQHPVTKQIFIDYIINSALKSTIKNKQLNFNNDGGYFYRNIDNKIIQEDIKTLSVQQLNLKKTSKNKNYKPTNIEVEKDLLSNLNILNTNTQKNINENMGGTLGYCGYQTLPLIMEQVPTSFWEYNLYNNMMWDWNQVMNVYSYSANDGFGANNGSNEFVNAISDATMYSVYGFNWDGALAMCITSGGSSCTEIIESDIMYNPAYSWTDDPNYAINNTSVYLLQPSMMHELGHSWGAQLGTYTETYDYDVATVMQGGSHDIYETGRGVHSSDAWMIRRNYQTQTSILSTVDVGIESYYAANGLNKSTTDFSTYCPGATINLYNITAENISYNAVSDVRVRFYLSSDRTITTSDYQIGGSGAYVYWSSFTGETYSVFDFSDVIPNTIPGGTYYVGMIITVNGFNNDAYTYNNTTTFSNSITINPLPLSAGTISGTTSVCQGQSPVTYTVPTISNATSYVWTLPTGATGSSSTNSIPVNFSIYATSGNITVKGNNNCGFGGVSTKSITVNSLPSNAGTVSGTASVCQGQTSLTYTVPTINNATSYIWILPTGATGTSSTNSITVNFSTSAVSGNITVKGHNNCGDGVISSKFITVNSLPTTPTITPNGSITFCQGSNVILSAPNSNSYNWSNGATSQSIQVSDSGTFAVQITNSSNCISASSNPVTVTVNSIPAAPTITPNGTTTFCQGSNVVLSSSYGYSYLWSNSASSQSITVTSSDTYSVQIIDANFCQSQFSNPVYITVNPTPTTPFISQNGNVLTSSSASGYQWYNSSGIINGATSQSYTATSDDDYYVIITENGCISSQSNLITVSGTSINNISGTKFDFDVFPNPATNELNIETKNSTSKHKFEIFNSIGQLVYSSDIMKKIIVNISTFANGIYDIKVYEGKNIYTKRLIKE